MNNKQTKLQLPFNVRVKKRIDLILEKKKTVIIFFVIGLILAAAITFLLPKSYKASSKIFFKFNSLSSNVLTLDGNLRNEIELLKSDGVIKNTAETLANEGLAVSVNDIKEAVKITEAVGSSSLIVNTISDEAEKSAVITNLLISRFQEKTIENNKSSLILLLSKIAEREKLAEENISRELSSSGGSEISSLDFQQEKLINQIAEFESELEIVELQNQFYLYNLEQLETNLEKLFPVISSRIKALNFEASLSNKTKLQRLEAERMLLDVSKKLDNYKIIFPWIEKYNLNELSEEYKDFNKIVEKEIDNIISSSDVNNIGLLKVLSKNIFENKLKLSAIDLAKSAIFNTLSDLEGIFNLTPYEMIDEVRSARTKKFNTLLLLKLKTKAQKYKDLERNFYAEVETISEATVPETYFSPNTTLNIFFGGLLGLIIGLLLAGTSNNVKIELIKNGEELEEAGYKIVAQIPSFPNDSPVLVDELSKADEKKMNPEIIKAFSSFETFLKYGSLENPLKTVLVTSAEDGEGKSIIASNIAIALAKTGNKVLLVDADLKNPQLHKLFRVKSTPSLAHFLFRKKELNEIIRNSHVNNLDLITCIEFPQNPSVIITSERMINFMTQVEDKYDYIVYDSASLQALRETASLALKIDEVILAVRVDQTKLTDILNAEVIMKEYGVDDFDIVLNDVKI